MMNIKSWVKSSKTSNHICTKFIHANFWHFCIGGAADKNGTLKVGDEIISVNSTDCTRMSRIEAWNFMKKLNDGTANLVVRHKIVNPSTDSAGEKVPDVSVQPSVTSSKKSPDLAAASTATASAAAEQQMIETTKLEAKR